MLDLLFRGRILVEKLAITRNRLRISLIVGLLVGMTVPDKTNAVLNFRSGGVNVFENGYIEPTPAISDLLVEFMT